MNKEIKRLEIFEKENNNLKKKLKENEIVINNLNNKINNLNKLLENKIPLKNKKNENNNDNKDELIELMKKLEVKNNEIKELKTTIGFDLKEGEKLLTIIFISVDQKIHYALICKNTDDFSKIEKLLYEKYPEYKKSENYFIYKGKKINRFETIEENNIEYSAIITLNTYE